VVMYTSSDNPKEREKAKQLGANDYIVKPSMIEQIAATLQGLKQRWLHPAG
jgi:PleD family two-component response regulator